MLDEKLNGLKDFIKSFIETYQLCLNTTNPNFLIQLVQSSTDIQDASIAAFMRNNTSITENQNFVIEKDNEKKENENYVQLLKRMLSGVNDLDNNTETSEQVKIHKNLVKCYFYFIKDIITDFVPKRIHHKMVKLVSDTFEQELDEKVFTPYVINRSFEEVMTEEEGVVDERQRIEEMLNAVNIALKHMVDIQCF